MAHLNDIYGSPGVTHAMVKMHDGLKTRNLIWHMKGGRWRRVVPGCRPSMPRNGTDSYMV